MQSVVTTLLLAAFVLSPVYLWESGLPQVSHAVAGMAIALRVLSTPKWHVPRGFSLGLAYVLYTILVDIVAYVLYADSKSLIAPTYYVFDLMVFVMICTIPHGQLRVFVRNVFWINTIELVGLAVLSGLGVGRTLGMSRSMGTLNDPNQMANWILWACIIVAATGRAFYKSWLPGALALGVGLLATAFTASRSGALGLLVLTAVYGLMLCNAFLRVAATSRVSRRFRGAVLVIVVLAGIIGGIALLSAKTDYTEQMYAQVDYWLSRFHERQGDDTLEGRGYDRIWKFPQYLLFGAGEGANFRYANRTWFLGEIHSSWAGLLFYYGVVGSALFYGFVYFYLRTIRDLWLKLLLLAPVAYGFATYNIRNWMFWVGLAVVYASIRVTMETPSPVPKSRVETALLPPQSAE